MGSVINQQDDALRTRAQDRLQEFDQWALMEETQVVLRRPVSLFSVRHTHNLWGFQLQNTPDIFSRIWEIQDKFWDLVHVFSVRWVFLWYKR